MKRLTILLLSLPPVAWLAMTTVVAGGGDLLQAILELPLRVFVLLSLPLCAYLLARQFPRLAVLPGLACMAAAIYYGFVYPAQHWNLLLQYQYEPFLALSALLNGAGWLAGAFDRARRSWRPARFSWQISCA